MRDVTSSNHTTPQTTFSADWFSVRYGLLALAMFSLAITTIVGNTVVIYALRTNRHLRTVMCWIFFFEYNADSAVIGTPYMFSPLSLSLS